MGCESQAQSAFLGSHGFHSQVAKSDALIARSFVIQSFERTSWETSDLDLFVERGQRANIS